MSIAAWQEIPVGRTKGTAALPRKVVVLLQNESPIS
jgi:hypothetical protein